MLQITPPSVVKAGKRTVWHYRDANFSLANVYLLNATYVSTDINTFCSSWSALFLTVMSNCIPSNFVSSRSTPWMSYKLIHRKKNLFRATKRSMTDIASTYFCSKVNWHCRHLPNLFKFISRGYIPTSGHLWPYIGSYACPFWRFNSGPTAINYLYE